MKVLVKMPQDEEHFIAAYAAIESYLRYYGGGIEMFLIAKENWITDLLVPVQIVIFTSVEEAGNNYDLALDFTEERAMKVAQTNNYHLSTCYGILLGHENVIPIPHGLVKTPKVTHDITILDMGDITNKILEHVQSSRPDLNITYVPSSIPLLQSAPIALGGRIIIGHRSALTYMACIARMAVIELYPLVEYNKETLAKWNKEYAMIELRSEYELGDWIYQGIEGFINNVIRLKSESELVAD